MRSRELDPSHSTRWRMATGRPELAVDVTGRICVRAVPVLNRVLPVPAVCQVVSESAVINQVDRSTRKLLETRLRVVDDSCPPLSSPSSLDVFSRVSANSFLSVPSPTTSRSSLSLDTSHVAPEVPPTFPTLAPPSFSWGNIDGEDCCKIIDDCYNEAIHWRHNLFRVPSGSARNSFVSELSCQFQAFGEESSQESIALTAAMLFPILMLQNPKFLHLNSKAASSHLSRRLVLWREGSFIPPYGGMQDYSNSFYKTPPFSTFTRIIVKIIF